MSTGERASISSRILLVEDDGAVATTLRLQLQMVGYTVVGTAATADAAVAQAIEETPDLILMDINLDGSADGIVAARRIGEVLDVPIVYLSAYSDEETIARAKQAEAYGYILKPFRQQHLVASITMALDRHRRHLVRQDERLHQALLARALEMQPDGVILFDESMAIVTMNPSAEAIFVRTSNPPTRFQELLPPEHDIPQVRQLLARLQSNPCPTESFTAAPIEVQAQRTDGDIFPAEVTLFLLPVMGKQHSVAMIKDLSEVERKQQRRMHTLKLEAMGRLSSIMAHDFNNLLGGLELQTEGLQRLAPAKDTELHSGLQAILAGVHHGRALTGRLADLTRLPNRERSWRPLGPALVGLQDFVARVVGDEVSVRVSLASDLGEVQLSDSELMQIMLNAATNARSAMPGGGAFDIIAQVEESGKTACLELRDNGIGMSAALSKRAFDPFFTTKEGTGSGLGLASIRLLAEDVGGSVELVSRENHGTSIQVHLPIQMQRDVAEPIPQSKPVRAGLCSSVGTILIIDDHKLMREALEKSLDGAGYSCHSLSSAGAALGYLQEFGAHVDLMVTDMAMPMMNGEELCQVVAKSCPHIASIITSGNLPATGRNAGASPWLQKPFSLAELEVAMEQAIALRGRGRGRQT
tara:strand:- start:35651 stop:37573 length:1923 start_codon:yes stop_codon:yes gene_type:complete